MARQLESLVRNSPHLRYRPPVGSLECPSYVCGIFLGSRTLSFWCFYLLKKKFVRSDFLVQSDDHKFAGYAWRRLCELFVSQLRNAWEEPVKNGEKSLAGCPLSTSRPGAQITHAPMSPPGKFSRCPNLKAMQSTPILFNGQIVDVLRCRHTKNGCITLYEYLILSP
ncbi:LANO_0E02344g1_1 [Lachancea nothofagi CBS 11611]|uniref:LANO_0E02344g1_1 n=1 Tax=Lachancea nothofagi CBS 11611 TaxID=1266666 RepID=A0A1G4JQ37_9SACH|nr:LANO_0E02344g1_1 [Lachancea nothofagi CBS 11611]